MYVDYWLGQIKSIKKKKSAKQKHKSNIKMKGGESRKGNKHFIKKEKLYIYLKSYGESQ